MDNHVHDNTVITASALYKYQECHRKYKYAHIDLLDINDDFANRLIGHSYHRCLDRAYNLQPYEDIILELQDSIPFPSENKSTSILRGMLSARFALESSKFLPWKTIIESEKELTLTIDDVTWAGKLDDIEENADGIWVGDTKLRNGRYQMLREIYENSVQLVMYTIMARHHGYNVLGYIVDCCRIPILKETKDWPSYVTKIHDDITSRPETYFARFVYPVDTKLVEKVFNNVRYWTNQIKHDTEFTQNFSACVNYQWGTKCPYYRICHENTDISTFSKKEKSHTELETI